MAKLGKEFLGKVSGGDEYAKDNSAMEETMTDKVKKTEETPEAEKFVGVQMSQEDFDALNAKATLADEQKVELDKMAEEKAEAKSEAHAAELRKEAEAFEALPVEVDEFVANMTAIDSAGEEAVAWFKAQFTTFDVALKAAGIFKDPVARDPQKRYKMLFSACQDGTSKTWSVNAAYSPDGIVWTDEPTNPVAPFSDTQSCPFWDARRGRYVAHLRYGPPNARQLLQAEL